MALTAPVELSKTSLTPLGRENWYSNLLAESTLLMMLVIATEPSSFITGAVKVPFMLSNTASPSSISEALFA
jgi:hypothetical protein